MIANKNLFFDEDGTCSITEQDDCFESPQDVSAPRCEVKFGNDSSDPIFLLLTSNDNQTAFFTIHKNLSKQADENSMKANKNDLEQNIKITIRTNNSSKYKNATNWRNERQTVVFVQVRCSNKSVYIGVGSVGIGILVLFLIGAAGVYCFMKRRRDAKNIESQLNNYCDIQDPQNVQYEHVSLNEGNVVFNFSSNIYFF